MALQVLSELDEIHLIDITLYLAPMPRCISPPQVLSELDEIHLIDINLAQQFNLNAFGTGYTGDACAYRVDCAAPFLLQPIAPDGRAYRRPRLQLGSMVKVQFWAVLSSARVPPQGTRLGGSVLPGRGLLGAQPLTRVLEWLAASKAAHFPAFDHAGWARRPS